MTDTDPSNAHDPCAVIENNYSELPKRETKIIFLTIICGTKYYAVSCAYSDKFATFIIHGL